MVVCIVLLLINTMLQEKEEILFKYTNPTILIFFNTDSLNICSEVYQASHKDKKQTKMLFH